MKKYLIWLSVIILVLYCSCTSSFKLGVYNSKGNSGNPNEFVFFEDSTFSYKYYSSIYKHSAGKFKILNNKILLNSNIKDIIIPVEYSILACDSLTDKNQISVQLEIPEIRKLEDYRCILLLNKDTLDVAYGAYNMYSSVPLDSVMFEIWVSPFVVPRPSEPLNTETIYFDKSLRKCIIFNITIDETLFGYRVFDNTPLEIGKNKIKFTDTEDDKTWRNKHLFREKRGNKNTLFLKSK